MGTTRQRNHTPLRKSSAKNNPAPGEGAPSLAKFSLRCRLLLAAAPVWGGGGGPGVAAPVGAGGGGCLLCHGAGGGCVRASPWGPCAFAQRHVNVSCMQPTRRPHTGAGQRHGCGVPAAAGVLGERGLGGGGGDAGEGVCGVLLPQSRRDGDGARGRFHRRRQLRSTGCRHGALLLAGCLLVARGVPGSGGSPAQVFWGSAMVRRQSPWGRRLRVGEAETDGLTAPGDGQMVGWRSRCVRGMDGWRD